MTTDTQALTVQSQREQCQIVLAGNEIRNRVIEVMCQRFRHRNEDGTIFTPRVAGSFVWPGIAQVIVVDPQRLWHFSIARMSNQDTLDLMGLACGRPVRAIRKIPAGAMGNADEREIMAYAVLLRDNIVSGSERTAGATARRAALPKMADLEFLAHKPAGDYMVGLGVGEKGEVWESLLDMLHIAFIGTTGSGKSTAVRAFVYQLAKMSQPVELYLADMEDMTFPWAENWPIVRGYAKDDREAVELTDRLVAAMEDRARLYREVRETGKYVEKWQEYRDATGVELPWIVAIFEEVSALAEVAGKTSRLMSNITQLCMRGRKYGITMVFSGQDFKADLFPSRVTNLIRTRLVYRTQTAQECRNGLGLRAEDIGDNGAERISKDTPGRFVKMLDGRLEHIQGFLVPKEAVVPGKSGAGSCAIAPAPARRLQLLSQQEAQMVMAALGNDGWFMPDEISRAMGGNPSGYALRDLARRWEERGWLEPARKPNQNGRGTTNSRRVTGELERMAREVLEA